jgi:endonuclease-3
MLKKTVSEIFKIFQNQQPQPQTELVYTNNYTLLVAVILSAQATDISVNKATQSLFKIVDNPQKMLEIGEEQLKKYISTIGLFNGKASNIIKMSKILIEKFDGQIPQNFEQLNSLPGVGRKTANVVLNCAFGIPTIGVDTHVFRVANRLGLVNEINEEKTEKALLKIIPQEFLQYAHHWLILHGRYVCMARKPNCQNCQIAKFCQKKFS